MTTIPTWFACCLLTTLLAAADPHAVPTFNCLGLYWKPAEGASDNPCTVQYRAVSESAWRDAQPLWFDATDHPGQVERSREYRGSIVGLAPGTSYEIRLDLTRTRTRATFTAATWSDVLPVARTVTIPAGTPQPLVISSGGSAATGYVVYTCAPGMVLDGAGTADSNITVNASYVILRGFTLRNARVHGIRLGAVQDVVVEDCDISGWGRIASDCAYGVNLDAAVYSNATLLERIVIQRCELHQPRSNSNSWTEPRPHNGSITSHPIGPQGISFVGGRGRYVIRHNRIWSDPGHKFNDGMGETRNFSYAGFPNRDSDIHDNEISNVYDDGAEVEGADMNVRVWGNRFDDVYGAIGAATSSLGPLYIWRNVMNRSRKGPGGSSDANRGAYLVKLGNENAQWCQGRILIFHNTMLQPPARPGFTGTSGGGAGLLFTSSSKLQNNITSRNNVLYVRDASQGSVRDSSDDPSNDYDHDLFNGYISARAGSESAGIRAVPRFDLSVPGAHPLLPGSPGFDAGVRLANFNDGFTGAAPDMGAFEAAGDARDTTRPSVALSAPATGATVTGNVTITASAADDAAVAGVVFRVDGVAIGSEDASPPYSVVWSSAAAGPGDHALSALARDASGNTTLSAVVRIRIAGSGAVAPPPTPTDPPNIEPPGSATPTLSGNTRPGATVAIHDRGVRIGEVVADAEGVWTWTVSPALAAGGHDLDWTASNAGGTSGHSPSAALTVPPARTSGGSTGEDSDAGAGGGTGCGAGGLLALLLGCGCAYGAQARLAASMARVPAVRRLSRTTAKCETRSAG